MATSKPRSRKKSVDAPALMPVSTEERHRMITEAAYFLAERRGFAGGSAEDDWLQAERDIDRALQTAQVSTDSSHTEARVGSHA